jgi:aspartate aminotransferase
MEISKRANNIKASATLAISARAKQMQAEGKSIINFTVGEPDFNTPKYIIEAAKYALDKGLTKYTASAGILPLRQLICGKLKRDNNLEYKPNQIVIANGAKQAITNAIFALIDPGDEVIIPSPYWVTYPELVKFAWGTPVILKGGENFKISPMQLQKALTTKTKVVIINSPNNPTGAVYTEAELRALAAVLEGTKIWVISDEVYEHLIYGDIKHFSIASCYDRTVVVNGFSKTFSMTGWRIGYSASSVEVATAIESIQSHMTSNVNTPTQYACIEALASEEGAKFLTEMLAEFDKRRQYMVERIGAMPGVSCTMPDGAFYVMVKFHSQAETFDTQKLAEQLLEHAGIATVPGDAFDAPGYIRFCYTVSMENIIEGMNRLEAFLTKGAT